MASAYLPTDDELRRAYQDTTARRLMNWSFEQAMAMPTVAIAVTQIAILNAQRPAPQPQANQLSLI